MAEPKTRPTAGSVAEFIDRIADETRRKDCKTIVKLMTNATGARPVMWGTSIVGFGNKPYVGSNGKSVDWPLIAFSPRKNELSLYVMLGRGNYAPILEKLGKHKAGKGCLYVKKLADIDTGVLETLLAAAVRDGRKQG